ncbi:signal peptide peptidase [Legionella beliardensis]|uniref:Signal peptide peptidase n=1 Tax=Legionella beliardensis TaxID=91822 RepID=A0A378I0U4_9GAMM|nr:S49 family peptidase [Legionella beliardensis]STX28216.1 signal peptide peptidase [Legionella beliardensis]
MNNFPNQQSDSQALLNQIILEYMRDQKRKRRWRWVFRFLIVLLIIMAYFKLNGLFEDEKDTLDKAHAGLIDLDGTIEREGSGSAENFVKGLDRAYKSKSLQALIVRINSPGGSPVQADYMYNALHYYHSKYPNVKIYAVCVDVCASAAYYVAAAADEIYANESSIVGSIGVIYNGFGFVDTMQKLGVSRRLQTAGNYKGFLDPFSPVTPEQQQLLQTMLNEVHQQFINRVKEGRGSRLVIDNQTFSGLFWTGKQAKARGLIDGFASSGQLARDVLKATIVIDYTHKQSVFEKVSRNVGTAIADELPKALGLNSGIKE